MSNQMQCYAPTADPTIDPTINITVEPTVNSTAEQWPTPSPTGILSLELKI